MVEFLGGGIPSFLSMDDEEEEVDMSEGVESALVLFLAGNVSNSLTCNGLANNTLEVVEGVEVIGVSWNDDRLTLVCCERLTTKGFGVMVGLNWF